MSKVLNGVDFVALENQVTTILGSSGSGKSTLLRCLNLLEIPDEGDIFIDNEKIELGFKKDQRIIQNHKQMQKIRTIMPMIFQHFNLWSHLNVLENIMHAPLKVLKKPKKKVLEIAMHYLQKVGLEEYASYFPNQLSGGQKQRVAIARAMAMQPKIILLDEPTSALDPEMVNEVLLVMQELTKEQCSMILVTHEISFAKNISDKIVFLNEGKIEEQGGKEILDSPQSKRLQDFLQYV